MDFPYGFFSAPVNNSFGGVNDTSCGDFNSLPRGHETNFITAPVGNTSFGGVPPSCGHFGTFSLDSPQGGTAAQAVQTSSPSISPDSGAAPAQPVAPSLGPVRRRGPGRPRKERPHDTMPAREGKFIGILWTRMDKVSKKDLNYAGCKQRPTERPHNKKIMAKHAGEYKDAVAEYEAERHRIPFPLQGRTTESVRAELVAVEQELAEKLSKIEKAPEKAKSIKIRVTMAEEKKAYLNGVLAHCEAQGATQACNQPPAIAPVAPVAQDTPLLANMALVEQDEPLPAYINQANAECAGQQQLCNDWQGEGNPWFGFRVGQPLNNHTYEPMAFSSI